MRRLPTLSAVTLCRKRLMFNGPLRLPLRGQCRIPTGFPFHPAGPDREAGDVVPGTQSNGPAP